MFDIDLDNYCTQTAEDDSKYTNTNKNRKEGNSIKHMDITQLNVFPWDSSNQLVLQNSLSNESFFQLTSHPETVFPSQIMEIKYSLV